MIRPVVEREAKLFEAGSYPDRGVEITEEDLDRIIQNTSEAPVRIEHIATPFDGAIGVLNSLYRKGRELFGRVCFTAPAWELVKSAGAKRLSIAIRKDKSAIAEVSLVREPRIADAAVFSEIHTIDTGEIRIESETVFADNPDPEIERLHRQLAAVETDGRIDRLKREGKLVPASEVFARAILMEGCSSEITFGGSPTPLSRIFEWFLETQPKVIEFSETAAFDPFNEQPELFARLGITSEQVERHRAR